MEEKIYTSDGALPPGEEGVILKCNHNINKKNVIKWLEDELEDVQDELDVKMECCDDSDKALLFLDDKASALCKVLIIMRAELVKIPFSL